MSKENKKVMDAEEAASITTPEVLENIEGTNVKSEIEVIALTSFGSPTYDCINGRRYSVLESVAKDWIAHGLAQKV